MKLSTIKTFILLIVTILSNFVNSVLTVMLFAESNSSKKLLVLILFAMLLLIWMDHYLKDCLLKFRKNITRYISFRALTKIHK